MRLIRLLSTTFIILTIVAMLACRSNYDTTHSVGIYVHEANKLIHHNEVVILDVRTAREFSKGHIDGAVNINIHDPSFAQLAVSLDPSKTYIVHCAVNPRGGRGDKSISILTDLGFNHLLSLEGGLNAWKRAGLPVNNA